MEGTQRIKGIKPQTVSFQSPPADWDTLTDISEDGLVVASDADDALWVVTADDPDGSGEFLYRVWYIPGNVEELPSDSVQEVKFESEPTYRQCVAAVAQLLGDGTEVVYDPKPVDAEAAAASN